jgi:hypothetical protein
VCLDVVVLTFRKSCLSCCDGSRVGWVLSYRRVRFGWVLWRRSRRSWLGWGQTSHRPYLSRNLFVISLHWAEENLVLCLWDRRQEVLHLPVAWYRTHIRFPFSTRGQFLTESVRARKNSWYRRPAGSPQSGFTVGVVTGTSSSIRWVLEF